MSGLINAARQNIWAIVNDLALAKPTPKLRIALLTFGNNGHDGKEARLGRRADAADRTTSTWCRRSCSR